jgi:Sec-independent protein translocase protein TatA
MKGLGKGVRSFKQGMNEVEEDIKRPSENQHQQPTDQQVEQNGK